MFARSYAHMYGGRANSFAREDRNAVLGFLDDLIATTEYVLKNPRILTGPHVDPDSGAPTSGILCISSLNCYRKDGSMHYGRAFREEALRAAPFKRIGEDEAYRRAAHPWMYGDTMDEAQKREFEAFVAAAQARGIALVGVQMPYHPYVFENTDQPDLAIIREFFSPATAEYFKRLGVIYFDYAKYSGHDGFSDRKFWLDSFHPTEAVVTRLLMDMAEDDQFRRLLPRLDAKRLEAKWEEFQTGRPKHPFDLWADEF